MTLFVQGFTVHEDARGLRAVHDRSGHEVRALSGDWSELRRAAKDLGSRMDLIYAAIGLLDHNPDTCRWCIDARRPMKRVRVWAGLATSGTCWADLP